MLQFVKCFTKLAEIIKKYWFITGLILIFIIILGDKTETVSFVGRWLRSHHGTDIAVTIIFFLSGLMLNAEKIKAGIKDITGLLIALCMIFIFAPFFALLLSFTPFEPGLIIGIMLVSVVPTTLSSGVVMTGTAGGNMAHALVITVLASLLSVFFIPVELSILLNLAGEAAEILINKKEMMVKISMVLLLPLSCGLIIKFCTGSLLDKVNKWFQNINQYIILLVVWMAMSQVRGAIMKSGTMICMAFLIAVSFHTIMLCTVRIITGYFNIGKGRRESVILMGCQKTLPLSLMLQVSLFPQYSAALVVCVIHHLSQLVIDGYMVEKIR